MKHSTLLAVPLITLMIGGCTPQVSEITSSSSSIPSLPNKGTVNQENLLLFPKQADGYIGDPMPYFDGEKLNLFYLHDARDGQKGFHPWYLMQTEDFISWEDQGEVIPYVNDYSSQDLALGTGSVIQDKQGLYHAFYTGFNGTGNMPYYEKIQHATSTNLIDWTKHPSDGFYGGRNDFRDPYLLYMEEEGLYWMLITTRENDRGVIKLYKSSDLTSWVDNGVFFRNDAGTWNMECPTLIKYNDYWYLSYSEQGNNRIVHYRYSRNFNNGWTTPEVDHFDGIGFYAGRIEKAYDRLFAFGWVGTKDYDFDGGNFNWAGNLVTHELIQQENGELTPVMVKEVKDVLHTQVNYPITSESSSITHTNPNDIQFEGRGGYEYIMYEELEKKATRLAFDFELVGSTNQFGLTFNAQEESYGSLNIVFNVEQDTLEFYNVTPMNINSTTPQISVFYPLQVGNTYHVEVLMENEVFTMYVNGEIAFTTRMYEMSNHPFGFFAMKGNVHLQNISFFE